MTSTIPMGHLDQRLSRLILAAEEHHVEWRVQSDRLYVLDVQTVQVGVDVQARCTWLDITDWNMVTLLGWLGY